jgi:predicted esterase YcpF (UPF0227 family)
VKEKEMIIFIHGRLSTPETSQTAKAIKEYFESKGERVVVPNYKPNDSTYDEIKTFFREYIRSLDFIVDEQITVIGISLGGYWALKLANEDSWISKCILLNPSLSYYGEELKVQCLADISVCLNMDDELLDPNKTLEKFEGIASVYTSETGGHRMSNINEFLKDIEKDINLFRIDC